MPHPRIRVDSDALQYLWGGCLVVGDPLSHVGESFDDVEPNLVGGRLVDGAAVFVSIVACPQRDDSLADSIK